MRFIVMQFVIVDVVNTGCDTETFVVDEESKRRAAVKSLKIS